MSPFFLWVVVLPAVGFEVLMPERPEDPPAVYIPRDDEAARSPRGVQTAGPYVSIQVNVDAYGQNIVGDAANEPSIAVNPLDPSNMVIGWRQFDSIQSNFRQAGRAYTFDAGRTWTFPGVLQPGVFRSDPVLAADSRGTFFYQSLWLSGGSILVSVFRSTDGGVTWSPPVAGWGGDKNWLTVDRSGGPGDGHLYGIWQRFFTPFGPNVFTRSTDGGGSFEPPLPVPLFPTFGTMAVGPAGEVYATGADGSVFQDLRQFVVAKSADARNAGTVPSFTATRVEMGGAMGFGGIPNPAGLLGQANVAVDRSTGPTRGNVYLVASVVPTLGGDPMDVHLARSEDGGASWSAPVRVNDGYDPHGTAHQWFAAVDVAPNGRIDVIWLDNGCMVEPHDPYACPGRVEISQLRYRWSYDGGRSWLASVAASPPFNSRIGWPRQNKLGDYMTLVSDATGADVAYAATFNGEQDVYYVRLFPDCNLNAVSDETDLATGASRDADADGIPDDCRHRVSPAIPVPLPVLEAPASTPRLAPLRPVAR